MTTTTTTHEGLRLVPEDLCPAAVKLARRIQALKNNRTYAIILIKSSDGWMLTVEDRGKAEMIHG
jgi:hypothetical protein